MTEDEEIIELFFARSERAIGALDDKYGRLCRKLSYNIVGDERDAEECVNDAYLGAWNAIPPARPDPLRAYILKIVRNLSLKNYYRNKAGVWAAAVILAAAASLGTALAVSDDFRQAVVSFLFPAYTDDRLHEIDEGHRTGSFSMEDTLFTFLERFNGEGMADVEAVKNDDGFEYVVFDGGDGAVNAVVDCIEPDYKLLVVMERVEYKDTTGLWQVTGYQIIDAEEADEVLGRY